MSDCSSFADIDLVPGSEKRIERLLQEEPNIGRIQFTVIEVVVRVYDDGIPLFAIGRYTKPESYE